MDTYEIESASPSMLNQQIASVVFSCMPEDGPLAVILDGHGEYWPSDAQKYSQLFSKSSGLDEIISRIDDGQDHVIGEVGGTAIVAGELSTKYGHNGYIIVALEGYTKTTAVENIALVETFLSMISLVGGLIQKANMMQDMQMKSLNYTRHSEACYN